ncbi:hypothetical protein GWK47_013602 [Chionoecetes opilio]|uniref:Uncharacterized protein n=1 Tax=Chionoecetes opilio TaxID=41210 RepID=A0A8J4Y4F3_CHIOP|nr:hypothetical protein GWK47_013602 [Chionoecetes opilio]
MCLSLFMSWLWLRWLAILLVEVNTKGCNSVDCGSSDGYGGGGDQCIVQGEQFLETPLNISILVFISPKHPLQFTLEFRDLDYVDYRDTLDVSNYAATHYKVRGGISSNTSHPLHLMVSEGWNRLRLVADGRHLSLKWIDENDEADLLALTLDFPLNIMFLQEFFSVCFGDSPEWDVGDGQQATVLLHPLKSEQQLVVTGQASSMPYLITDSGPIRIVTNTTLTVKIRRQNSTSVIKIVQTEQDLSDQPYDDGNMKNKGTVEATGRVSGRGRMEHVTQLISVRPRSIVPPSCPARRVATAFYNPRKAYGPD